MKRKLTLMLLITILISACSPSAADVAAEADVEEIAEPETVEVKESADDAQTGFTVTDALGREITFDDYPENIVIAGKLRPMIVDFLYMFESSADKIAAIEAGGQASENFIAVLDETVLNKYSLEKGAAAEQIAPLEPDLVILKASVKESLGDSLELINIPVVYIDFETVDQIYRDIRILGTVLGESDRAEEIVAEYEDLYEEFSGYIKDDAEGNSAVLMQISSTDQEYAYEVPSVSYLQTTMVEDAGGQVLWKEAAQAGGWNEVNLEQVNVWNPDYIFVINYKGMAPDIVAELSGSQPFGSLAAVANEQIYAFPFDYISWDQPDPRWILGYSWLVYRLNPGEVSQERMLETVSDFYQFFYGMEEAQVEASIMPRIVDYY
jgi:iron complex transport system substrate-binding protein